MWSSPTTSQTEDSPSTMYNNRVLTYWTEYPWERRLLMQMDRGAALISPAPKRCRLFFGQNFKFWTFLFHGVRLSGLYDSLFLFLEPGIASMNKKGIGGAEINYQRDQWRFAKEWLMENFTSGWIQMILIWLFCRYWCCNGAFVLMDWICLISAVKLNEH